jgi:hypothetical protein
MRRIRAIVYGVGTLGKTMTKLMVEKGVDIVGAIDPDLSKAGKDLGEVAELGFPLNVIINGNADAVLSEQRADIAVVAIFTDMGKMYPMFKKCIENGLNVITTAEEASYPWVSCPELASKLDKLARKHGVTITGCGNQDFYYVNVASLMTGACHEIESVTLVVKLNVDNFGPALVELAHVGETKEEFHRKIKGSKQSPSIYTFFLEQVIADLGLTIKSIQQSIEPVVDDVDLECKVLGKAVGKGLVTGIVETFEINTEQGIKFLGECIVKLCREGEEDTKEWIIKGAPNMHLKFDKLESEFTTCTQMVNRIPDVINSEPGLITVENLPKLKFRAFPLQCYLEKEQR